MYRNRTAMNYFVMGFLVLLVGAVGLALLSLAQLAEKGQVYHSEVQSEAGTEAELKGLLDDVLQAQEDFGNDTGEVADVEAAIDRLNEALEQANVNAERWLNEQSLTRAQYKVYCAWCDAWVAVSCTPDSHGICSVCCEREFGIEQ